MWTSDFSIISIAKLFLYSDYIRSFAFSLEPAPSLWHALRSIKAGKEWMTTKIHNQDKFNKKIKKSLSQVHTQKPSLGLQRIMKNLISPSCFYPISTIFIMIHSFLFSIRWWLQHVILPNTFTRSAKCCNTNNHNCCHTLKRVHRIERSIIEFKPKKSNTIFVFNVCKSPLSFSQSLSFTLFLSTLRIFLNSTDENRRVYKLQHALYEYEVNVVPIV